MRGHYLRLLPLSLTALRAALAPALVVILWCGGSHVAFGLCLVTAFLSDVFDGIVARRLGVATPSLRRLDSVVDTLFYLCALYCVWHLHPDALRSRVPALAALGGLEAVRYGFDWLKFGREASYHMWSSKLWGIALFVACYLLLARGSDHAATGVAIYLGIFADLEGLAISCVLDGWRADVPSLIHALMQHRTGAPYAGASIRPKAT